ncbi:MAG: hypothetical protein GF383_14895 [Candidatus Lokiarchaeota archaeon]|nr:hypothetical protein [Candidatus Lokiarchaeota archaeon]MBD3342703.1 hypothetical protein [Candidatus Lokiarchaeota archaeon]
MGEKKIGVIRIDWLNKQIEFSPNIKINFKKSNPIEKTKDVVETIIKFEIENNELDLEKYQKYISNEDKLVYDEPLNIGSPWYLRLQRDDVEQISGEIPFSSSSGGVTPLTQPEQKKGSFLSPPPKLEKSSEAQDQLEGDLGKDEAQIKYFESQITSINNIIQNLDKKFRMGSISLEEYLEKKNFLTEKMESIVRNLKK